MPASRRVLAAPDKFRGTASAPEVAAAIGRAARAAGWDCDEAPVADGGEGTLEVLGGAPRYAQVRDPLGRPVRAEWRWHGGTRTAVVEMARASGLGLVGGAEGNDPIVASTAGTGDLIAAAIAAGARRVIVAVGGSATTDGGLGCIEALSVSRLAGVEIVVACDVTTSFVDAAEVFAPQKGATAAQVALLRRRLERLVDTYRSRYGVDVSALPGSGAAGGLAGGLAALGGRLVPGFDLVADRVDLAERAAASDLVITGEGLLDEQSFRGKTVGGVVEIADGAGRPVAVVVGDIDPDLVPELPRLELAPVSLVERFGRARSDGDVLRCVEEAVATILSSDEPHG